MASHTVSFNSEMKIFVRSFLASFAVAATGKATLEFNVANDSGSGSDGSLKV